MGLAFLEVQFETPFYDDIRGLDHFPCQQGILPNYVILGFFIFTQLPLTMMTIDLIVVYTSMQNSKQSVNTEKWQVSK